MTDMDKLKDLFSRLEKDLKNESLAASVKKYINKFEKYVTCSCNGPQILEKAKQIINNYE